MALSPAQLNFVQTAARRLIPTARPAVQRLQEQLDALRPHVPDVDALFYSEVHANPDALSAARAVHEALAAIEIGRPDDLTRHLASLRDGFVADAAEDARDSAVATIFGQATETLKALLEGSSLPAFTLVDGWEAIITDPAIVDQGVQDDVQATLPHLAMRLNRSRKIRAALADGQLPRIERSRIRDAVADAGIEEYRRPAIIDAVQTLLSDEDTAFMIGLPPATRPQKNGPVQDLGPDQVERLYGELQRLLRESKPLVDRLGRLAATEQAGIIMTQSGHDRTLVEELRAIVIEWGRLNETVEAQTEEDLLSLRRSCTALHVRVQHSFDLLVQQDLSASGLALVLTSSDINSVWIVYPHELGAREVTEILGRDAASWQGFVAGHEETTAALQELMRLYLGHLAARQGRVSQNLVSHRLDQEVAAVAFIKAGDADPYPRAQEDFLEFFSDRLHGTVPSLASIRTTMRSMLSRLRQAREELASPDPGDIHRVGAAFLDMSSMLEALGFDRKDPALPAAAGISFQAVFEWGSTQVRKDGEEGVRRPRDFGVMIGALLYCNAHLRVEAGIHAGPVSQIDPLEFALKACPELLTAFRAAADHDTKTITVYTPHYWEGFEFRQLSMAFALEMARRHRGETDQGMRAAIGLALTTDPSLSSHELVTAGTFGRHRRGDILNQLRTAVKTQANFADLFAVDPEHGVMSEEDAARCGRLLFEFLLFLPFLERWIPVTDGMVPLNEVPPLSSWQIVLRPTNATPRIRTDVGKRLLFSKAPWCYLVDGERGGRIRRCLDEVARRLEIALAIEGTANSLKLNSGGQQEEAITILFTEVPALQRRLERAAGRIQHFQTNPLGRRPGDAERMEADCERVVRLADAVARLEISFDDSFGDMSFRCVLEPETRPLAPWRDPTLWQDGTDRVVAMSLDRHVLAIRRLGIPSDVLKHIARYLATIALLERRCGVLGAETAALTRQLISDPQARTEVLRIIDEAHRVSLPTLAALDASNPWVAAVLRTAVPQRDQGDAGNTIKTPSTIPWEESLERFARNRGAVTDEDIALLRSILREYLAQNENPLDRFDHNALFDICKRTTRSTTLNYNTAWLILRDFAQHVRWIRQETTMDVSPSDPLITAEGVANLALGRYLSYYAQFVPHQAGQDVYVFDEVLARRCVREALTACECAFDQEDLIEELRFLISETNQQQGRSLRTVDHAEWNLPIGVQRVLGSALSDNPLALALHWKLRTRLTNDQGLDRKTIDEAAKDLCKERQTVRQSIGSDEPSEDWETIAAAYAERLETINRHLASARRISARGTDEEMRTILFRLYCHYIFAAPRGRFSDIARSYYEERWPVLCDQAIVTARTQIRQWVRHGGERIGRGDATAVLDFSKELAANLDNKLLTLDALNSTDANLTELAREYWSVERVPHTWNDFIDDLLLQLGIADCEGAIEWLNAAANSARALVAERLSAARETEALSMQPLSELIPLAAGTWGQDDVAAFYDDVAALPSTFEPSSIVLVQWSDEDQPHAVVSTKVPDTDDYRMRAGFAVDNGDAFCLVASLQKIGASQWEDEKRLLMQFLLSYLAPTALEGLICQVIEWAKGLVGDEEKTASAESLPDWQRLWEGVPLGRPAREDLRERLGRYVARHEECLQWRLRVCGQVGPLYPSMSDMLRWEALVDSAARQRLTRTLDALGYEGVPEAMLTALRTLLHRYRHEAATSENATEIHEQISDHLETALDVIRRSSLAGRALLEHRQLFRDLAIAHWTEAQEDSLRACLRLVPSQGGTAWYYWRDVSWAGNVTFAWFTEEAVEQARAKLADSQASTADLNDLTGRCFTIIRPVLEQLPCVRPDSEEAYGWEALRTLATNSQRGVVFRALSVVAHPYHSAQSVLQGLVSGIGRVWKQQQRSNPEKQAAEVLKAVPALYRDQLPTLRALWRLDGSGERPWWLGFELFPEENMAPELALPTHRPFVDLIHQVAKLCEHPDHWAILVRPDGDELPDLVIVDPEQLRRTGLGAYEIVASEDSIHWNPWEASGDSHSVTLNDNQGRARQLNTRDIINIVQGHSHQELLGRVLYLTAESCCAAYRRPAFAMLMGILADWQGLFGADTHRFALACASVRTREARVLAKDQDLLNQIVSIYQEARLTLAALSPLSLYEGVRTAHADYIGTRREYNAELLDERGQHEELLTQHPELVARGRDVDLHRAWPQVAEHVRPLIGHPSFYPADLIISYVNRSSGPRRDSARSQINELLGTYRERVNATDPNFIHALRDAVINLYINPPEDKARPIIESSIFDYPELAAVSEAELESYIGFCRVQYDPANSGRQFFVYRRAGIAPGAVWVSTADFIIQDDKGIGLRAGNQYFLLTELTKQERRKLGLHKMKEVEALPKTNFAGETVMIRREMLTPIGVAGMNSNYHIFEICLLTDPAFHEIRRMLFMLFAVTNEKNADSREMHAIADHLGRYQNEAQLRADAVSFKQLVARKYGSARRKLHVHRPCRGALEALYRAIPGLDERLIENDRMTDDLRTLLGDGRLAAYRNGMSWLTNVPLSEDQLKKLAAIIAQARLVAARDETDRPKQAIDDLSYQIMLLCFERFLNPPASVSR